MISFLTKHTPWVPTALFVLYVLEFLFLAINPLDRGIWFAENITVVLILIPIVVLYVRGVRLSNLSYILMSVLVFLHTLGGHYTFAQVPFASIGDFFGFERNNFDRFAHFSVGFYAFPIAELVFTRKFVSSAVMAACFAMFAIGFVAGTYEIVEWIFAILNDPNAGAAFLGSQGDEWDAQKDMLADISGAIAAGILFLILGKRYAKS